MDPSSLPEVTLPIDDALFASCKEILAKYDPQYDANAMPANLEEAKSDLTKMAAMLASIERAQQAIETKAAALTGRQSVSRCLRRAGRPDPDADRAGAAEG